MSDTRYTYTDEGPVFADYVQRGKEKRLKGIYVRIGGTVQELPIKFMRVSEIPKLNRVIADFQRHAESRSESSAWDSKKCRHCGGTGTVYYEAGDRFAESECGCKYGNGSNELEFERAAGKGAEDGLPKLP